MSIDKAMYELPAGMDDQPELEIDMIVAAEEPPAVVVELEDGGVEITVGTDPETNDLLTAEHDTNLAELLDEDELLSIGSDLLERIDSDVAARKDWVDTFTDGLEVLGFKYEERTSPWAGACGVHSNVLSEAVIRFQAEGMSETFPAAGPVRTMILGEETREKIEAAERVKHDMNYEILENMVEYRAEHERLLYALGLAGSAFKKVYWCAAQQRQTAMFVPAEDLIVPYSATHIDRAERVTHVMRKTKNEVNTLIYNGFYRDVELGEPADVTTDVDTAKAEVTGFTTNDDDRYTLYEVHVDLCIEGLPECEDGLARPYIVTMDKDSGEVLSLYRNWSEGDMSYKRIPYFVHYNYVPGFGFYGLGLIHIVGNYARAGTSLIRQLVDAGTLANLPGGLKTRGMRTKNDDEPISPGEWKDVDVPSGTIRDNIMPLPYKEPSQTLLALLSSITEEGRRLGAISDMNIADMSANAPVGTTLALLERTLKPMAAVQSRVHYAMKTEFKILKRLIADHAPSGYGYTPTNGPRTAKREDYEMVEVIPVSDPNSSTMAQRVVQYQTIMQMSQMAPQLYDLPELHRQMLEAIGVKNAEKLVPLESDTKPLDPVSENMAILTNKPIKAAIYQDHDAHIAAHTALMQDPTIAQMIGQNPMANSMMAALQAHIAEHLAFQYRKQIEEKLGAPLPVPGEELPPEIELQLSRLVAQAGVQLSQMKQQQAAAQQAAAQAQDPLLQLQQMEAQTKAQEVQRKAAKDQMDAQLRAQEMQRKATNDRMNATLSAQELALKQQEMQIDAAQADTKLATDVQTERNRTNLELSKMLTGARR